jgi:hypothetical protein
MRAYFNVIVGFTLLALGLQVQVKVLPEGLDPTIQRKI